MVARPSENTREELYKYDNDQIPLSSINIAYGSRMSINQNLATQAKIFNGAMGIVRGNKHKSNQNIIITIIKIRIHLQDSYFKGNVQVSKIVIHKEKTFINIRIEKYL